MKNYFSITLLFVLFFNLQTFSQSNEYGVSAGYNNFILSASVDGFPGSGSEGVSGYYVGFYSSFELDSKWFIQPELQFSQVFNEGENLNMLVLPVMFKFYLVDKFNIQAGPSFDLFLNNEDEEVNDFSIGLGFGGAYDITDELSITTRYSVGLTNRTPDFTFSDGFNTYDISTKSDYFQIGLTYKLQ